MPFMSLFLVIFRATHRDGLDGVPRVRAFYSQVGSKQTLPARKCQLAAGIRSRFQTSAKVSKSGRASKFREFLRCGLVVWEKTIGCDIRGGEYIHSAKKLYNSGRHTCAQCFRVRRQILGENDPRCLRTFCMNYNEIIADFLNTYMHCLYLD